MSHRYPNIRMQAGLRLATLVLGLGLMFSTNPLLAATWKPLCPVGSDCGSSQTTTSLVIESGVLLPHRPVIDPFSCDNDCYLFPNRVFRWSEAGLELLPYATGLSSSDSNAIQLDDGTVLRFGRQNMHIWKESENSLVESTWTGDEISAFQGRFSVTGPPVTLHDKILIGITHDGGTLMYSSLDRGQTWSYQTANIRIGDNRYSLLPNPEKNGLWAISTGFNSEPDTLWESRDDGVNWARVDDGTFPHNTFRVVPHPSRAWTSYALTEHGLFVSRHRGTHWQPESLTGPVYSLLFVDLPETNSRAMVAGTASGIMLSLDNGTAWSELSKGLLEGPYSVVYSKGQLVARGATGVFTCDGIDCADAAQVFPPEDGEGLIEVVEYYNTILDHYFITGSESEKSMLDQADASAGWERTGESFLARPPGKGTDVCRFYGSVFPGPNSHFYSSTPLECRLLQELQQEIPEGGAGWKFEGWAFSVLPVSKGLNPCRYWSGPQAIPVYRAYNNGFALGKDSNHRYVTDLALMDDMTARGWIDEGIAFCSPLE